MKKKTTQTQTINIFPLENQIKFQSIKLVFVYTIHMSNAHGQTSESETLLVEIKT